MTARKIFGGRTVGQTIVLLLVALLVAPPLWALIAGAFSEGRPSAGFTFSWGNLERAFSNPYILHSLLNSVVFAFATSTAVVSLGAFIAWVIERTDSRFSRYGQVFSLVPILIPAVTLVSAWIMLLSPRGGMINLAWQATTGSDQPLFDIFSFPGMVWIATLQELPLAVLWLWPVFRAMNPDLEEAARVAGAGNSKVLFRITLPILRPALLGAWIIFFIYSLGALSVAILIGLPAQIFLFATEIYVATTRMPAQYGLASFYSLLFLVVTVVAVGAYYRLIAGSDRFATIRGKAYRPRRASLGRWRGVVDAALAFLIVMIAVLPIMILTWNAFMPYPQLPSWQSLGQATLSNFTSAWNYGPAMRAIWNSLWIGTLAGVTTTLFGAVIAWMRLRQRDPYGLVRLSEQAAMVPMSVPGMIVGVGLLWFWLAFPIGIYATPWILMLAYIIMHLPYAVRIASSGIVQLHAELEEAAHVAGADTLRIIRLIVLPLIAPTLVSATVYTSLRAFREYSASLFLTSPGTEVFSVVVLDMWQGGNSNVLAAYTVMVMVLLTALVSVATLLTRRFGITS